MSPLLEDLRFSLRVMRRSPGLTLVAVLTLSLGIAANTTVFGWIDSVLLNPVPGVRDAEHLYVLETVIAGAEPRPNTSFRDFQDYRAHLPSISGIAVSKNVIVNIGPDGDARRSWGEVVSANYFDVLGVRAQLGRTFDPDPRFDAPGAQSSVVISDRLWRSRFGADPAVVGKTIRVNRHELRIEGVAPAGFHGSLSAVSYDLWIPFSMQPALGTGGSLTSRATRDCTATFVRLRPGETLTQARGEARALSALLARNEPVTNQGVTVEIVPLLAGHGGAQGVLRTALVIVMLACALLQLIVCGNISNLLLAQSVARHKEFGVRLALGARRGDLVRLLFAHALLLSVVGSAAAVLAAVWMSAGVSWLMPVVNDTPLVIGPALRPAPLAFMALLCVGAALLSGISPALVCSVQNLRETLDDSGRGGGAGRRAGRLRAGLVTAEVALASVALMAAGLCLQSFRNAARIQPGFEPGNVTVAQYFLAGLGYKTPDEVRFLRQLRDRLTGIAGISEAAYSEQIPLTFGLMPVHQMEPAGYAAPPGETLYIHRMFVSPGWFRLMRIPLLDGRDFLASDKPGSGPVMIVNRTFVERYWGGAPAVGRKVRVGRMLRTVVGVVGTAKYHRPAEAPLPFAYLPFDEAFSTGLVPTMYVRSLPGAERIAEQALRSEARLLEPGASSFNLAPLADHIDTALYTQRLTAGLLGMLGVACLLLAALGLYGVVSYSVGQRTHEIGVRLALGAAPSRIVAMVLRDAAWVGLPGAVAGSALSLLLAPKLGSLLVGVSASDPKILGSVWAFLTATCLIAGCVPALRAARVQPVDAIRDN